MRKNNKNILALLIVVSMLSALLIGCGTRQETGKTETTTTRQTEIEKTTVKPIETKPLIDELVIYGPNRIVPEPNQNLDWMQEEMGVKLNFIIVPDANEYRTKLNLLITSGDIPDIVTIINLGDYYQYVEEGFFVELEPLLKEYAPNVYKYRPAENFEQLRYKDGKLYVISNDINPGFVSLIIRKDYFDNLGLQIPTSLEEFFEVCKSLTFEDPNKSGKDDTYGFGAWGGLGNFAPIFIAHGAQPWHWIEKNGELLYGAIQPEVKEALKYLRKLYINGIMEKEFLTIDFQKHTESASLGKWGIWQSQLWYAVPGNPQYDWSDGKEYAVIPPPKGQEGKSGYSSNDPRASGRTGITSTCKDPATAARFINFLANEETFYRIRTGVEGVHYTVDPNTGQYLFKEEYGDRSQQLQEGIAPTYSMAFMPFNPPINYFHPIIAKEYLEIRRNHETYGAFYDPVPVVMEQGVGAALSDIMTEEYTRMIMGDGDIDQMFDTFVKKWLASDGEKLIQLTNEYWQSIGKPTIN